MLDCVTFVFKLFSNNYDLFNKISAILVQELVRTEQYKATYNTQSKG
jgi:hypothetical protein